MQIPNSIKLGTTANLILGLKAGWNPSADENNPFFIPSKTGLWTEIPDITPDRAAKWTYPTITLHDTPESLLSNIYEITVASESDELPVPSYPVGTLMLDDADRAASVKVLQSELGIDLTIPDRGYALIKVSRTVGSAVHKTFSRGVFGYESADEILTNDFQRDITKLRPGKRIVNGDVSGLSQVEVQGYLDFYSQYGTHFVSQVSFGDTIYQVFAYEKEDFAIIQTALVQHPEQFSGMLAFAFSFYTRPKNVQGYGSAVQTGNICSLSRDSAFSQSVNCGHWKDSKWAMANSILTPWLTGKVDLNKFTSIVIKGFELRSLNLFAEHFRKSTWRKVFKAAMYVKHGDNITPAFSPVAQPNYDSIYGTNTNYLSMIATPSINLYKTRQNLSSIQLIAAQTLRSFTLFANLIEIPDTSPCSLPGDNISLAAHIINVGSTAGKPAVLKLSDEAYDRYFLTCNELHGALMVKNTSGAKRHLLADGIRYDLSGTDEATGRLLVVPTEELNKQLSEPQASLFFTSLQFAITGAESILNASICSKSQESKVLITEFIEWVAQIIPTESTDTDLHKIRLNALYLSRAAEDLANASRSVPYLTYKTYQPLIESIIQVTDQISLTMSDYQKQITVRQQQEQLIEISKNLNENIVETGNLLKDYINASVQQQRDLSQYYQKLSDMDDREIAKTAASIKKLTILFNQQQDKVNLSIEKYKTAVYEWETMEILKFSIDIAAGLFSLGAAIVAPEEAPDALKKMGEMAVKIQQFMSVMQAMAKLGESVQGGLGRIQAAEGAFESLNSMSTNFPTALEWNEFQVNYKLALGYGPDISEKAELASDFEILCLRGQALLNAQANEKKMVGERYVKQLQQDMSDRQKERLSKLDKHLKPKEIKDLDTANIDLVGLTGELEFKQQQILMVLAKTIETQDLALQYEYLQQPMPMTSFDILSLKYAIYIQNMATINALEDLSPVPQRLSSPITYTIEGVPATSLVNGNAFRFAIPVSAREFKPYTMVRVEKVVANIEGIQSTASGNYIVDLLYIGRPFEDRDQDRNILYFNTVSRRFSYLYNAVSGKASFGDGAGAFSSKYSKITPFSEWEISLPDTETNKELAFKKTTVQIKLTFSVVAQLNDAQVTHPRHLLGDGKDDLIPVKISKDTVLKQMFKRSVLKGWDVVFNYAEENINQLLLDQYNDRKNNPQFVYSIPERTDDVVAPDTGVITRTKWSMDLGAPRIQFLANNSQYCEVYMEILGGNYEYGILVNGTYTKITGQSLAKGTHIKGNVKLEKLTGAVDTHCSVVVNLSSGAFDTQGLEITVPNPLFDGIVTDYFQTLSTKYIIGTLDLANHTTLDALIPKSFFFHVLQTNSKKNILQLFIATDKADVNKLTATGIDVDEPIPEDYGCSLIISSRILFDQIMHQGFQNSSTFTIQGVAPADAFVSWESKITNGSITGTFVSSNKHIRISGNSNQVVLKMAGLSFMPEETTYGLLMSYAQTENRGFQYYTRHTYHDGTGYAWDTYSWDDYSLSVTVTVSGILSIAVSGTGQDQKVQIQAPVSSININGALASGGACSCDDRQLQQEFLGQLQAQLPSLIRAQVDIPFNSVSLFAVKNLLFPCQNIVDLKAAYAPGDLIIFGDFTK